MTTVFAFPLDTWGMHDGVGAGWGIVMVIGMFLFWGAIVLGIAWLIRAGARGAPRHQREPRHERGPRGDP